MPGPLYTQSISAQCPHGGLLRVSAQQTRVRLSGQPLLLQTDPGSISGCPFQIPAGPTTKPQPCVRVTFLTGATRIKASGKPVLLPGINAICQSAEQIPQGPPSIAPSQAHVKGT